VIGFCRPDRVVDVADKVVGVQRDRGNRASRKHPRLKYTIEGFDLDWFQAKLANALGYALGPARPYRFD
jgi:sulfite reductase (NADPH) hemoprotein beta-component